MASTHDDGRLFGTDGRSIWWEVALELVAPAVEVPADNVTVTECPFGDPNCTDPAHGRLSEILADDDVRCSASAADYLAWELERYRATR